jgi:FkbM family methyltransferase
MLKKIVRRTAKAFGYEVLPRWRIEARPLRDATRKIFDFYSITTVIDVGANEGQYRDFLRYNLDFEGRIHSFEPDPDLVAQLEIRARKDPRWTIHPFALGSAPGRLTLNIFEARGLNSFKAPTNFACYGLNERQRPSREVDVKTLDSVAAEWPELVRTFVKIDTQGFDVEVFKGGARCFATIPALQTEINMFPMYEDVPDFYSALEVFAAKGFALSDLFCIGQTKDLRAREFDCLMVRGQAAIPRGGFPT